MSRSVEEWIGASDDSPIPPRVRLRVFEAYGGVCQLSGRKIRPGDLWDLDHRKALCNGGKHAESNLWPVLREKHIEKTKADVALKSKADRIRKRHLGLKKRTGLSKHPTLVRGFDGKVRERRALEQKEGEG